MADLDGYARRAVEELTAGLATLDMVSYSASYRIDLAVAHAVDGDLRAASAVLDDVEQIAAECRSARMSAAVDRMRHRIG